MKIVKKIGLFLVLFIAFILIVALFVPQSFQSQRSISINAPKDQVFAYIKLIKNQDNYGVWQLADPSMVKTLEGTDGTVGFVYSWKSKTQGDGSQTITKVVEGKRIETALDFGFGEPAHSFIKTATIDSLNTSVTWGIKGKMPYPFNLMSLFHDMGKDFEQGLSNLKKEIEHSK